MERNEVIKNVLLDTRKDYTKEMVTHLLKSVTTIEGNMPDKIKKGDIITMSLGAKKRPFVIIKVYKDYCYAMPLSSTKDELFLTETNSRFMSIEGHFTKTITSVSLDYCLKNYCGIYDNPSI